MAYIRIIADKSFTSDVIRFTLHEMFSHVGFKLDDEQWLDCRLDGGVQIRPADSIDDTKHIDFQFPGIEDAITFGKTLIGIKYDVNNLFNFLTPSWPISKDRLICSRFIRMCAEHVHCPLVNPTIADYQIAPAHFIYPIGVVPGVVELDRFPKGFQL